MKRFFLLVFLLIVNVANASLDFSDFSTRGFEGRGPLEFNSPEDIIITPDGQFIIVDQKNNRLQVTDSKGDFIRFIPANKTKPVSLTPSPDETTSQKKIRETEEKRLTKVLSSFRDPIGTALDSKSGKLYVSLMKDDIITIFDFASGNLIGTLGHSGKKHGEFYYPMDIDVSSDGLLAVAEFKNKRVQVIDLESKQCVKELIYQEQQPNKAPNSVKPRGVHWTNDGRLIVTYPEYNQVVCWQPMEGQIIWRYGGYKGSEKGKMENPSYVCDAVDGNILVTDTLNHRIVEISRDGKFCNHYGKRGTTTGKLSSPRGLVLTPDENLAIVDQGNNRIHFFKPGQATLTLREAKQYALKDDWENARQKITKVLYLQPNNEQAIDLMVNALYYFGDQAFKRGDYREADENYRKIRTYRPDDANISEKLDAVFWASNEKTITSTILVAVVVIGGLFCLWIIKVFVARFLSKNKQEGTLTDVTGKH